MTNYEWLLNMSGEERQAWFDAPHADCEQVDSGANISSDTKTLIIADVNAWIESNVGFSIWASDLREHVIEWLDRQAMISERFMAKRYEETSSQLIKDKTDADLKALDLQERIAELQAQVDNLSNERNMLNRRNSELRTQYDNLRMQVDNLAHDLRESERLREEMREELSIAYDHAHDLLSRRDRGLE